MNFYGKIQLLLVFFILFEGIIWNFIKYGARIKISILEIKFENFIIN